MDVDTDEELLQMLAAGGTIDYDLWPRLLLTVIERIETIVETEYPIPVIPPPRRTQSKLPQPPLPGSEGAANSNGFAVASASRTPATNPTQGNNDDSRQDVDKENTDPVSGDAAAGSSSTANSNNEDATATAANGSPPAPSSSAPPAAAPAAVAATGVPVMPKPVLELVDYIITTLKTTFAKYPPHSIQRLAELILSPRQHYRYLASYLHAIDRVISVTSCSNIYPLPPAVPDRAAMAILASGVTPSAPGDPENGGEDMLEMNRLALAANPAGDNSLGALLTPIPWLRRRPSSGAGDDNTTDDGSSPPSSTDGSDIAFSASSSAASGSVHGGLRSSTSQAASTLHQQQLQQQQAQSSSSSSSSSSSTSASQQQQLQLQHPPQHRMEVRTEATETIDGPNGVGSIETVSVSINGIPSHGAMVAAVQLQQQRGITQGELLRQEQTAGVVPVSQLARAAAARAAANGMPGFGDRFHSGHDDEDEDDEDDEDNDMDDEDDDDMERHAHTSRAEQHANEDTAMGGTGAENVTAKDSEAAEKAKGDKGEDTKEEENGDEEEIPHARGPQEIGAADMGPQRTSSRSGRGASLLIGSAADASQVDMRDIDVEAAVGRRASAFPAGTVAAPVVPFSSRESVRERVGEEPAAASAAAPTPQARPTTPKREAEQALEPDVPTKRRKEDHSEGGSGEGDAKAESSTATTTADGEATAPKDVDSKESKGKSVEEPKDKSPEKDDETSAAA